MIDLAAAAIAAGAPALGFIAGLVPLLRNIRRARPIVRAHFERIGYHVVEMQYRYWRRGPFPWTGPPLTRVVFRLVLRDEGGRHREAWARWGGTSFRLQPEQVDRWLGNRVERR